MKKNKWMLSTVAMAALLVAVTAGACTAAAPASASGTQAVQTASPAISASPAPEASDLSFVNSNHWFGSGWRKYTKADYDLALSFRVSGWLNMSLADFNASLLKVDDEEAYHKVEDSLLRVVYTLDSKDPNADFLLGTLANSLAECRVAHYNACANDRLPQWSGSAEYTRYADVYGDQVPVAEANGGYWFRYSVTNPAKTTVAQRDAFLQNLDKGMQDFLNRQSEDALIKEDSMTKALQAELVRLTGALGGAAITVTDCEADYEWYDFR